MTHTKRVSLLLGLAATAALGGALPAFANETEATAEMAPAEAVMVETEDAAAEEMMDEAVMEPEAIEAEAMESEAMEAEAMEPASMEAEVETDAAESVEGTAEAETSADMLMEPEAAAPASMTESMEFDSVQTAPETDNDFLAQITTTTVQGVSPAYIGVGGNLGIGDDSPLSDFGFAVISKFSLSPRFSVRPAAIITEDGVSFPIPVTYNFNTTTLRGVAFQPYVGAGVDVPTKGGVGLLLNAGIDVPISPQFTLNATSLVRVTDGFGLGIVLGVGYNFPLLFD